MSQIGIHEDIGKIGQIDQLLSGREYLRSLVEAMAKQLDVAFCFIGRAAPPPERAVTTLELWAGGKLASNFRYELAGTPCANVIDGQRVSFYGESVAKDFPDDVLLSEMNVKCYVGAPIVRADGGVVGLLVALDNKPREDKARLMPVLDFFAGRAGAELERERWEAAMLTHQQELETRVEERTRELKEAQKHAVTLARRAGMADVASGVLHNVGNLLTGASVSAEELQKENQRNHAKTLHQIGELLNENEGHLDKFFSEDPRGKRFPLLFLELARAMEEQHQSIHSETEGLTKQLRTITEVIAQQQEFASPNTSNEELLLQQVFQDALAIMQSSLDRNGVVLTISGDKKSQVIGNQAKLMQILANLLGNAVQELEVSPDEKRVEAHFSSQDGVTKLKIGDSGRGVVKEMRELIFTLGCTSKDDGHGIGLHTSAVMAHEMGGSLVLLEEKHPLGGASFELTLKKA